MRSPLDKAKTHEVVWHEVSGIFDAARRIDGATFVYFIGEGEDGPLKVGFAKDPIARVRTMQTGNPRRLKVERILVGDMALEKLLHELWAPFALENRREWFRPEVRATLYPIVATAANHQVELLSSTVEDIDPLTLERIVREAHIEHDFVAQVPHQVRRLGRSGGYAVDRASRI